MRIQHNISALNTHRNLAFNNTQTSKALEKLSSGYKINRAGDDAAGLAISEKMRGQIRGLDMASKNAQDGISLIQTTEGALNETHSILQRMRELAVQAANDTNESSDRGEIQKEINQLTSEINRIGNTTEFNTKKLLNGDLSATSTKNAGGATDKTVSGKYSADFSPAANWGTTGVKDADGVFKGNGITFSKPTTGDFTWGDLDSTVANGNKITVTRDAANDTFKVDIIGTNSQAETLSVAADDVVFDKEKNEYSYNANGVSFTIDGSKIADWKDGESFELDLSKYDPANDTFDATAKPAATVSDFTANNVDDPAAGETYAAFKDGITVDSDHKDFLKDVAGIKITASDVADAGQAKYVVELLAKDGTTKIATETFDAQNTTIAAGTLSYNQNGIKFDIDLNDATDFEITRMFDVKSTPNTKDNSLKFQIGANEHQALSVSVEDMRAEALGIVGTGSKFTGDPSVTNGTDANNIQNALDLSSHENAASAITTIDAAINKVSSERAKLGAVQNRLEHTINNLGASSENLTAAESRIRDTDMAKEMMNFTKNNILTQAAQSMLAQANQQPQGVLQLLG